MTKLDMLDIYYKLSSYVHVRVACTTCAKPCDEDYYIIPKFTSEIFSSELIDVTPI